VNDSCVSQSVRCVPSTDATLCLLSDVVSQHCSLTRLTPYVLLAVFTSRLTDITVYYMLAGACDKQEGLQTASFHSCRDVIALRVSEH